MMNSNQEAYDRGYQRAVEGKSPRSLWDLVTSAFEDEYTRKSREKGTRDGAVDRAATIAEDLAEAEHAMH